MFSARTTKEVVHANIYNRAFNGSYVGADGVSLLNTAHVTDDGTQSNTLAVAADLSETSLEDLLIQIRNMKDSRGLQINGQARKLIVAPANMFNAERITGSYLQNDTANNAINAMCNRNSVPEGYMDNPYLTDEDAWFVRTDIPNGMCSFNRNEYEFSMDNDFDTMNIKHKYYERYVLVGLTGAASSAPKALSLNELDGGFGPLLTL